MRRFSTIILQLMHRTGLHVACLARRLSLAIGMFVAWMVAAQAIGQDSSPSDRSPAPPPAAEASTRDDEAVKPVALQPLLPIPEGARAGEQIRYVGPDTYILLDASGRPQLMPGMTYDDFMAAWKQSRIGAEARRDRRFLIESLDVRGSALDRYSKLRVAINIRLLTNEEVSIPLGLGNALLESQPQVKFGSSSAPQETENRDAENRDAENTAPKGESGDNAPSAPASGRIADRKSRQSYVDFDPQQGGYVARLSGNANQSCAIEMELLIPIEQNGAVRALDTNWPRALQSKLELDVDHSVAEANVNEGAVLTQAPSDDGQTRFTVVGLGGQFHLSWSVVQAEAVEPATVLSATGALLVTIDGRSVQTDARISVQSFGGKFDRFRVLLPRGAKLIQDGPSTNSAAAPVAKARIRIESSPIESKPTGTAPGDVAAERQVVLVELAEKQQGPFEIRLQTEQPIGLLHEESSVELGGFEVVGAVRQFGDIALRATNDWQLRWRTGGQVRQVDAADLSPTLQQPGVTAAFQYDRQPWSLNVDVTARQSRLHVTPDYELQCLPDEARLRVRLAYQVLGARTFEFLVDLKGWELTADPVESNGLVDSDRIMLTREGMLVLRLTQAAARRAEITFHLRRSTPRSISQLDLPLPVPQAESVGAGVLTVRSSPGIELVPELSRMPGLAPLPISATSDAADAAQLDAFRYRYYLPDAAFRANRISRSREVSTEIETEIELTAPVARVAQHINYDVQYEPIKDLVFEMPEDLLADETVLDVAVAMPSPSGAQDLPRVSIPLTVLPIPEEYRAADLRGARRLRASLPQAVIGKFSVVIEYAVPRSGASSDGNLVIPLVRSADGKLIHQRAIVQVPPELSASLPIDLEESSWRPSPRPASRPETPLELVATHGELSLPLTLQQADLRTPAQISIDRVWLQTWIASTVRQDRAAYQFRAAGGSIAIELPLEVAADQVEVLLDGRPPESIATEAGRVIVSLPDSRAMSRETAVPSKSESHTLELRYRQPILLPLVGRHRLSPPQLVGNNALAQVFWQIVAPGDQHVIQGPQNLSAASRWQWLGAFWGRRSTRSQGELEAWVGATNQLAPTEGQNEYLYSGFAPVTSIEVVTAPRWLIVLAASASCLLLTMAVAYLPQLRRGWLALVAAVALLALAAIYPIPAMLLGQAAVLGAILSLLAIVITRLASKPLQFPAPSSSVGSTFRKIAPRAESHVLAPPTPAASTAPLHVPEPGQ